MFDLLSAAPKAAIEALVRGLAVEEGRYGIRANCAGPGLMESGLGLGTIHPQTQGYIDKMTAAIPLQRRGQPRRHARRRMLGQHDLNRIAPPPSPPCYVPRNVGLRFSKNACTPSL